MSFRSPTPDGLAISPNAAGNVNNPAATPQELQAHHYWGRYALTTQLPNIGFLDGVAVVGTNPASAPAYAKLAPGDLGFVQGANPFPDNSNLYVCTDRGTLAGNDAHWITLGNAAFTQTIRDAHVMVVAQDGWLAGLGGQASPPNAANNFNLSAAGDVVGITCDYLDPGDGSELTLALSAATGSGVVGIDIRLRPMELTLTAANSPLTLTNSTRLIGAGMRASIIIGLNGAGEDQMIVDLQDGSLEDIQFTSEAPLGAPGGTLGDGIIQVNDAAIIRRCRVEVVAPVTPGNTNDRNANAAIRVNAAAGVGDLLVDDCELFVDTHSRQNTPGSAYGVRVVGGGDLTDLDAEVRNTTVTGGINGSCSHAVAFENIEGGRCFNVEHIDALGANSIPVFSFSWTNTVAFGAEFLRGPRFESCRSKVRELAAGTTDAIGFWMLVSGATVDSIVTQALFSDCQVEFPATPVAGAQFRGFWLASATTVPAAVMSNILITACSALGAHQAFDIDASSTDSLISSVRLTNCWGASTYAGTSPARGLRIRGNTASNTNPNVQDVGVTNCDFREAGGATGVGVDIADNHIDDTIVVANSLRAGAGTALVDAGVGTEAAHNILV